MGIIEKAEIAHHFHSFTVSHEDPERRCCCMKNTHAVSLVLILILSLTPALSTYAETTPMSLKDVFLTTYSSAKVLAENDDYIVLSADYEEIQQINDTIDNVLPDGKTLNVSYKLVILLLMQGDKPIVCAYIPVNEDGTLGSGGNALDPNTQSTVLVSPAFLMQNMSLTPTTP